MNLEAHGNDLVWRAVRSRRPRAAGPIGRRRAARRTATPSKPGCGANAASQDPMFHAIIDRETAQGCRPRLVHAEWIRPTASSRIGHIHYAPGDAPHASRYRGHVADDAAPPSMRRATAAANGNATALGAPSRRAADRLRLRVRGLFRQALVYKRRNPRRRMVRHRRPRLAGNQARLRAVARSRATSTPRAARSASFPSSGERSVSSTLPHLVGPLARLQRKGRLPANVIPAIAQPGHASHGRWGSTTRLCQSASVAQVQL